TVECFMKLFENVLQCGKNLCLSGITLHPLCCLAMQLNLISFAKFQSLETYLATMVVHYEKTNNSLEAFKQGKRLQKYEIVLSPKPLIRT
ncbi:hypothetical protein L9F63_015027, partial [Diploptera punctata]